MSLFPKKVEYPFKWILQNFAIKDGHVRVCLCGCIYISKNPKKKKFPDNNQKCSLSRLQQISVLEWFLKDHVTLKTGVMVIFWWNIIFISVHFSPNFNSPSLVWKSQKNAQNQRQNSVQSHECQSHSVCIIKTQRKADALQMPVRDLVLQCEMCFDQRWHWRWPNANERTRHRVRESSGGVIDLQQNISKHGFWKQPWSPSYSSFCSLHISA